MISNRRPWLWPLLGLALMLPMNAAAQPAPSEGRPAAQESGPPPARDDMPDWQVRLELARLLSESGRHAEAAEEYRRALGENPNLPQAHVGLARSLFWSGHPAAAMTELDRVPPESLGVEDLRLRAELLLAAQRHDEAIGALKAYLAQRPDDLEARLQLADALSWRKRLDESLAEYETILKARPEDRQVRRAYARVLTWAGRNDDAIRELRQSLGQ
ncbi:MAG: tetratricopeptide repeat protein [Desulfovibrionaceae bacterium]